MREILTLQFGHYANYIGAHFWNIQNAQLSSTITDINKLPDHRVLFRAGLNPYGEETYTPRTLIFDLKGSGGSLSTVNELYTPPTHTQNQLSTWNGAIEQYIQPAYAKNDYLSSLDTSELPAEIYAVSNVPKRHDLDHSVHVWSDYNKQFYHPRTMHETPGYFHGGEIKFDMHTAGKDIWHRDGWDHMVMEDSFRYFVEECDNLQGIQCIADIFDAFGGLTVSMLENIREELPKTPIVVFGVREPPSCVTSGSVEQYLVNVATSIQSLSELSTTIIPLIAPNKNDLHPHGWSRYMTPNLELSYHSAAILATVVDSVTVPYRMHQSSPRLSDMCSFLDWRGKSSILSCSIGLVPIIESSVPLQLSPTALQQPLWRSNSWMFNVSSRIALTYDDTLIANLVTARGVSDASLSSEFVKGGEPLLSSNNGRGATSTTLSALDSLGRYFSNVRSVQTQSFACSEPMPVPDTYPYMFTLAVQASGHVTTQSSRKEPAPTSVPIALHLSTSTATGRDIDSQYHCLRAIPRHVWEHISGSHYAGENAQSFDSISDTIEWLAQTADEYSVNPDDLG